MACKPTDIVTDFGCIPTDSVGTVDPAFFVEKFYGVGLGIIGGVSVLFITYGGYLYLTSQGNPVLVEKGKRYIFFSIIGLLFAVFGYVFIQLLAVDILHIPGFQ